MDDKDLIPMLAHAGWVWNGDRLQHTHICRRLRGSRKTGMVGRCNHNERKNAD
jgi:hypothetical protein